MARLYYSLETKDKITYPEQIYLDKIILKNYTLGQLIEIEGLSIDHCRNITDEGFKSDGRWKGLSFTVTDLESGDILVEESEKDNSDLVDYLFSKGVDFDVEINSIHFEFNGEPDFDEEELKDYIVPKVEISVTIEIGDEHKLELENKDVALIDYYLPTIKDNYYEPAPQEEIDL